MGFKTYLAFAVHSHQPVGNFDWVIEEAYQKSYSSFLTLLERFPFFKVSLHYSGSLLEWIDNKHPEFFSQVKKLIDRGQVDILGGGFYEPILPVIPDGDKIGQIMKLSQYIRKKWGRLPEGMWVTERVWESQLPKVISQAALKFTMLDDTHFQYAGLSENQLEGYFLTEEEGEILLLFPISKKLRYSIPFGEVEKNIDFLRNLSQERDFLIIYADDGEKFGTWPGTYKHCWQDKWLENFFKALQNNQDKIEIIHFSQAFKKFKPKGGIYLPSASYPEMMHWALPVDKYRDYENLEKHLKSESLVEKYSIFLRGGFWRNFLVKYPESNRMHKRMLYVSRKLHSFKPTSVWQKKKIQQALNYLWRAQSNCPYWHGIFGGIYLNYLRFMVYNNLIQAENLLETLQSQKEKKSVEILDLDKDGEDEVILRNKFFNLYLSPSRGGCAFELDYKDSSLNLIDTISRRPEGYHLKIVEMEKSTNPQVTQDQVKTIHGKFEMTEKNLGEFLNYDSYQRASFLDHFLPEGTTLENFAAGHIKQEYNFLTAPYNYKIKSHRGEKSIMLFSQEKDLFLSKEFRLDSAYSGIVVNYSIENRGEEEVYLWFGIELPVCFLAADAPDRFYVVENRILSDKTLKSSGEEKDLNGFGVVDEYLKIKLEIVSHEKACWWRVPVYTISLSEKGAEKTYQYSVLFPHWKLNLAPHSGWQNRIIQKITSLK